MAKTIKLLELFSGIQSQERAFRQLGIPYECVGVSEIDKNALVSSMAMRFDVEAEMSRFEFPDPETMITVLQKKMVGYDFKTKRHAITKKTPIKQLKLYYLADALLKNYGDISKMTRLPDADLVTYSAPCTNFSVAGLTKGAKKTCNHCNHEWDIDFSYPEYNYKCPKCGSATLESTASGLLQEVQRLLAVAHTEGSLPAYLILENVKNLTGKKFLPQFLDWINWLDSIGYNTYWKIEDAKRKGIPQSRERVFAVSIRKDADEHTFQFPEDIPLEMRIKDILETSVDKSYYLPADRLGKLFEATTFPPKKTNAPIVKQVFNVMKGEHRDNPNQGRCYDTTGVAPALTTMQGGNRQPYILEEYEPFIVASRGRNPDNPSDRTTGAPTEQRLEPNCSGTSNCLTSVAKDNYVCEPIIYDDYNSRISADQSAINTLTCNCGASAERNGVKIIEPAIVEDFYQSREPRVYDETAPTLRGERSGLKVVEGAVERIIIDGVTPDKSYFIKDGIAWRIRKLTEKECFRLTNFTDEDCDKAAKYTKKSHLYKHCGNSIVVANLIAIFSALFISNGHRAEVWTKYILKFSDRDCIK
jgi:DNA (cytosine-5)-methyltransferase 1